MCINGYHTETIKEKVGKNNANLVCVFYRREIRAVQDP